MRYRFIVDIEVLRTEGLFATRDELEDQLREAIESADPGTVEGDEGGSYETVEWTVDDAEPPKPPKRKASA
jgi:hypothetical protein